MEKIRINDLRSEYISDSKLIDNAIKEVLESGWYVLGDKVNQFEYEWSRFNNVNYSVGVGNGMDAIEIILRTLNIGRGDEVITTSMTAFPTVLGIIRSGATPVLADINTDDGLMSIESASRCITGRTKAIVLVHLYGFVDKIKDWEQFCATNHLKFVEDCAQSHLAEYNGKSCGSFGEAGAFSFYPTKNLGAMGDGGIITTDNQDIAKKAKILRNYGQCKQYVHTHLGTNSRLDEIQASVLSIKLKSLTDKTILRRVAANYYYEGIRNNKIQTLRQPGDINSHSYHQFVIKTEDRNQLKKYLTLNGIESLIHYPTPIHKQEICKKIQIDPYGLKNSETHASMCLSIPCHPFLTKSDREYIVKTLNCYE